MPGWAILAFGKREIKHNDKKVVHHENLLQTNSDKDEIEGDVDVSNGSFSFSFSFDCVFLQSNSFYSGNHILCSLNTNNGGNHWGRQSSNHTFCLTIAFSPFIDFCEPVFADKKVEKIEIGGMGCLSY